MPTSREKKPAPEQLLQQLETPEEAELEFKSFAPKFERLPALHREQHWLDGRLNLRKHFEPASRSDRRQ